MTETTPPMTDRQARKWVRGWWADQMRNPTAPELPLENDEEIMRVWASESAKLANRIDGGSNG